MSYHLPNIRHKKAIKPDDFIYRINLYAAWIHILNSMIQSLAGQWKRFAKAASNLAGAWRIQADVSKVEKAITGADVYLEKFADRLDACDLAEWRNIRNPLQFHDKEAKEINLAIRFFGIYYKNFLGRQQAQDELWEFMGKYDKEFISDDATDIFALNYLYTLNIENDGDDKDSARDK